MQREGNFAAYVTRKKITQIYDCFTRGSKGNMKPFMKYLKDGQVFKLLLKTFKDSLAWILVAHHKRRDREI